MPIIYVGGIIGFAPNVGVLILDETAADERPEELLAAIRTAFQHIEDPELVNACCGGEGLLAQYSTLAFDEYLQLLARIERDRAALTAKRTHTRIRRTAFDARRSQLILAMLDAGIPYMCAEPGCGVIEKLTVDHLKALSRGGSDDVSNLRFMCAEHNSRKGDR